MNPSYCRIRIPFDEALIRFAAWNQLPQVGPLVPTDAVKANRLACDDRGNWRGYAVFVSEVSGWTLFEDLSGALGGISASKWLEFAGQDELIVAGYNDAIPYGALVVVSGGCVIREFLEDLQSPEANVNIGLTDLPGEPFGTWIDVAGFVDEDELGFSESGFLWVWGVVGQVTQGG